MRKVSDLPEFSAVLDAHAVVLGSELEDGGDDGMTTGIFELDEPVARQWLSALPGAWGNDPEDEPFISPLAELVQRISVLSGIACPELDQTEGALATAVEAGGFDDEQ